MLQNNDSPWLLPMSSHPKKGKPALKHLYQLVCLSCLVFVLPYCNPQNCVIGKLNFVHVLFSSFHQCLIFICAVEISQISLLEVPLKLTLRFDRGMPSECARNSAVGMTDLLYQYPDAVPSAV